MSKLRLIGVVIIVLFLSVIIALGVIAINLANLAQSQGFLTEQVNAIKTALYQISSTNTTTTSGTNDQTSEEASQNKPVVKECANTTLKFQVTTPIDWNCEDSGDIGGGQSYLSLTKGNTSLTIGTPAIGFNCVSNNCTTEYVIDDSVNTLPVVSENGKVVSVLGRSTTSGGLQISVRSLSENSSLTDEFNQNRTDIITIVNSLRTL